MYSMLTEFHFHYIMQRFFFSGIFCTKKKIWLNKSFIGTECHISICNVSDLCSVQLLKSPVNLFWWTRTNLFSSYKTHKYFSQDLSWSEQQLLKRKLQFLFCTSIIATFATNFNHNFKGFNLAFLNAYANPLLSFYIIPSSNMHLGNYYTSFT